MPFRTKPSKTRTPKAPEIRRRRRYSAEEKQRLVKGSLQPGVSRAAFAQQHGINPTLLDKWRKLYQANEAGAGAKCPGSKALLVEASLVEANEALQQQVRMARELQRVLGKLALENELLKEAGALQPREAG